MLWRDVTGGKIIVVKMGKETNKKEMLTCIQRSKFAGKTPKKEKLQKKKTYPSGSQPLNGGSRRSVARVHPFQPHS